MPNVRKRIEMFEQSLLPLQGLPGDHQSFEQALPCVSDEDLNLPANEAETEGRALTAREMQAQRAFARAVAESRFS